jgi:ketosteroid isomerase-like protein
MPNPHEDLIRQAYAAFNRRDVDAGVALMAADVDWPDVPNGGFVHGRDRVRQHWHEQFGQVDPTIELEAVSVRDDGRIAALVRQVVRSLDGMALSNDRSTHVFTVEHGLITRMDVEQGTGATGRGS